MEFDSAFLDNLLIPARELYEKVNNKETKLEIINSFDLSELIITDLIDEKSDRSSIQLITSSTIKIDF